METLPPPECQQLPKRFTHLSWPNFHPKVLQIEVGKARGVGLILTEPAVKGNKAESFCPAKSLRPGTPGTGCANSLPSRGCWDTERRLAEPAAAARERSTLQKAKSRR